MSCYCTQQNGACGSTIASSSYDVYYASFGSGGGANATVKTTTRTTTTAAVVPAVSPVPTCGAVANVTLWKPGFYCSNAPSMASAQSVDGTAFGCAAACCKAGIRPPFYYNFNTYGTVSD